MAHYLLVYDRTAGQLLHEESFDSRMEAMLARFKAEKRPKGAGDVEVVVLSAASRDDLLRTHSRYFQSFAELTGQRP